MKQPGKLLIGLWTLGAAISAFAVPAAAQVSEHEPNNSAETATPAALGDTLLGTINPVNDADYYAFDIAAGTKLDYTVVSARSCLRYNLTGPDGRLFWGGCDDSFHGTRIAPVSGRYTLRVSGYDWTSGGPDASYAITLRKYTAPPPGPGDPTTLFATGFLATAFPAHFIHIDGAAADRSGGLYIATDENRVNHVSSSGRVEPFTQAWSGFGAMAVDGFGDLLLASYILLDNGHSTGVVWRFGPSGQQSTFVAAPEAPNIMFTGLAVGPDGDVWFADPGMNQDSKILRYDPVGNLKEKIDVSATGRAWNMAMSPSGDLYYANQTGDIYKLVGSSPHLVAHAQTTEWGNPFAFDRDGYVYLLDAPHGKVVLFDPQFHVVADPFSQVLDSLGWSPSMTGSGPVFLRDQNGGMTRRIMVTRWRDPADSTGFADSVLAAIRELNVAAVRAPGADVVPHLARVQLASGDNPTATVGAPFADSVEMVGAGRTATWELVAGQLPRGVSLDSHTGGLHGTPRESGSFDFSVRGTSGTRIGYGRFQLTVNRAAISVAAADVATALLGGPALPDSTVQFLDQLGNHNGRLDAGDLRAYLRAQGQRTPAAALKPTVISREDIDRLRALVRRGRW